MMFANLFFRVLIAWVVMTGFARAHDIWSRAKEYNQPNGFPCCGGDPMTGDCEGLSAEDIWDQPDGSVIIYSHRYKSRILIGASRVHTDVPRDVNTKEPLDALTRYEGHFCGKPRSASFGYSEPPSEKQSDPAFWTFCFFRNAGGS